MRMTNSESFEFFHTLIRQISHRNKIKFTKNLILADFEILGELVRKKDHFRVSDMFKLYFSQHYLEIITKNIHEKNEGFTAKQQKKPRKRLQENINILQDYIRSPGSRKPRVFRKKQ